jgi:nitrogen fixation NifU-like protein
MATLPPDESGRDANPVLRDHFLRPRRLGPLEHASGSGTVENPVCGDVLTLEVRVEGSRLAAVRFRAAACSTGIAVASILAETLDGAALERARRFSREELAAAVGPVPPSKGHALTLALDALRAALASAGIDS